MHKIKAFQGKLKYQVSNNDEMYKLRFGWGKVLGFC